MLRFRTVIALLVTALAMTSCVKVHDEATPTGLVMKVGRYYWPSVFWVDIADKKGWFREAGLKVELIDTNPDWAGFEEKMVAGELDVHMFTFFDVMMANVKGADLVVVLGADVSAGADMIVARQGIHSVLGLKGRRVGLDLQTFQTHVLYSLLKDHGLLEEDVIKVHVPVETSVGELAKGNVDAVMTWEPFGTEAVNQGGNKIFNSAEIPGLIADVFPFHRRFIENRPGDVQAFVNVWHRTTQFITEHPEEAYKIIAGIYGKTPKEVLDFASRVHVLNLRDNLNAFLYGTEISSFYGLARNINDFLMLKGVTVSRVDLTETLDPEFLRKVS